MSDELIIAVTMAVWAIGTGIGVWHSDRLRRAYKAQLRRLAKDLGLRRTAADGPLSFDIHGEVEGCEVHVTSLARPDRLDLVQLRVGLPAVLSGVSWSLSASQQRVRTGDPALDDHVALAGDEAEILALLSPELRAVVQRLAVHDVTLEKGELRWEGTLWEMPAAPVMLLPLALTLAREASAQSGPDTERRALRACDDPEPGVRLRNLESLAVTHRNGRRTQDTLRAAMADPDARVRVFAAALLEAENTQRFVDIFEDPESHELGRLAALEHLAAPGRLPADALSAHLRVAFEAPLPRLNAFAERLVIERELREHASALRRRLVDAESSDAERLVAGLRRLGDTEAEAALLEKIPGAGVSLSVALGTALGELGTMRSAPELRRLSRDMSHPFPVRKAAQTALVTLEDRFGGREGGALAVADTEAQGALSPTQVEGALSSSEESPQG